MFLTGIAALSASAQEAPPPSSFLPNGAFSDVSGTPPWPAGWEHGPDGVVSLEREDDGRPFLRIASTAPGQLVRVWIDAPLSEGRKGLACDLLFRVAGFKFGSSFSNDMHASWMFLDSAGKPVKGGGGGVLDSHAKTWTPFHREGLVPAGAAKARLILSINKAASGTLDIASASFSPLADEAAQAMIDAPGIAAKKEADDRAALPALLALPSKAAWLHVEGNRIADPGGKTVVLRGVNVESLEWSPTGEQVLRTTKVALVDWKANVVRLPVIDDFWFGRGKPPRSTSNDAEAYRKLVDDVVRLAAGQGAHVVLDLHRFRAPTEAHVAFWKDAAARYKNEPAVLFDLFNEPGGVSWDVWKNGGDVTDKPKGGGDPVVNHFVGMQALLDAVRSTGAKNIVLAGGLASAYDLQGLAQGFTLEEKGGNGIVYSVHFYNWHKNWQKHFLFLAEQYPLFVGETGADVKKMPFIPGNQQEDPSTWVPATLGMIQQYGLSWTAFSLHPKSTPVLISDWSYTPTPFWGVPVQQALVGKAFPEGSTR